MNQRILGVDPGTIRMGYGLVEGPMQRPRHIISGTCTAPSAWSVARRLAQLQGQLQAVVEEHRPSCIVIETSFHGKNSQALLRLGEARGVVIGLAGRFQVPVHDYTPAMVKKAVTGRGNAAKEAVARMVHALLPGVPQDSKADSTDALAVALCHCHRERLTRSLGLDRKLRKGASR